MKLTEFKKVVEEQVEYFSGGTHSFEELLRMSRSNIRLAELMFLYSLVNSEYKIKYEALAETRHAVGKEFARWQCALRNVERNKKYRVEARETSRKLRLSSSNIRPFYSNVSAKNLNVDDLEKVFVTLVNSHVMRSQKSVSSKRYVEEKMKNFNKEKMFVEG